MNYLAHIQLAHLTQTSSLGNFLGDFVKGSDLAYLPLALQEGIRLHRAIDTFTDQHILVKDLKRKFPKSTRRMSGVVIDIYFDHLLCLHWQKFNTDNLNKVLAHFYAELKHTEVSVPGRFAQVKLGLLEYRWLHDYLKPESVSRAFYHIEKRLGYRVNFAQESIEYIDTHQGRFADAFNQFYPELIQYCKEQCVHKV